MLPYLIVGVLLALVAAGVGCTSDSAAQAPSTTFRASATVTRSSSTTTRLEPTVRPSPSPTRRVPTRTPSPTGTPREAVSADSSPTTTPSVAPASAGVPPASRDDCPPSHPVKGNQGSRNRNDWIYHVPGSRFYVVTDPEECFATASDAEAAGYRAPRR